MYVFAEYALTLLFNWEAQDPLVLSPATNELDLQTLHTIKRRDILNT